MAIMFITADIEGTHQLSHKLPILPIHDILKEQGYDVIWGSWNPWGIPFKHEDKDKEIDYYVTADKGIPGDHTGPITKTFIHPHGLSRFEYDLMGGTMMGSLVPGELWYSNSDENANIIGYKPKAEPLSTFPITGWAKLDALFKNTKEETIAEYGLNLPYDKTVIYAPAGNWDYCTTFDISIKHIIELFSRLPYNLIIKNGLYSASFENWNWYINVAVSPHINKIQGAPLSGANIDITPLYNVADVLLTDGSSVAWEFIGTDKPTVQLNDMIDPWSSLMRGPCNERCSVENEKGYRFGKEFGKSVVINDHPECQGCGGSITTSLEDLEKTIVETVETPDIYRDVRRKWSRLYNRYVDGKCAQRCVDAIKRIANI